MVYDLPPELAEKARIHLNETPEVKAQALVALREQLASLPCSPHRTDDDFLLRFLRQKKFRVGLKQSSEVSRPR
jgi:hypothetical protein